MDNCTKCGGPREEGGRKGRKWCRQCECARTRAWCLSNPERYILNRIRSAAKRKGIQFSIKTGDIVIPKVCPILGIELKMGVGHVQDDSPSLDRIDPRSGYIPGNVAVISMRANRMKQDATASEHRKIAEWMDSWITS